MSCTPFLFAAIWATGLTGLGQTADSLVLQGRAFLAAKNMTNANSSFAAAVQKSPSHQTANALYAATRLLSWPYTQPAQDMMDRLGVSLTNRNIYKWTARLPKDTNGVPIPANDLNASELVAVARTNVLPEITGSLANLAKVTDSNFILNLASNETTIGQVIVDFGDIQMLQSLLHTAEFLTYTVNSYNLSAQLNALYNLHARDEFTIDHLLAEYPLALTFATTSDLPLARNAFGNAVDSYLAASQIIRSRPTNIVRLFNYDPTMADKEAKFRQTLVELKASLNGPVSLTYVTNKTNHIQVDLGRMFDGSTPPRSLLPTFRGSGILLGSLPDPTFNGLVFGLSESDIYRFVGSRFQLLSNFRTVRRLQDGRLELDLNAADDRNYGIEASTNLVTWAHITVIASTNGVLTFFDPQVNQLPRRFYRARDLSGFISFEGIVLESGTGKPIGDAIVSSSLDGQTAMTDAAGHFLLQTQTPGKHLGFYTLVFSAAGYDPVQLQGVYTGGNRLTGLRVSLSAVPTDTAFVWAQKAGGNATEMGQAISVDSSGNCFITGIFPAGEPITFGNTTLNGTGTGDGFIAKYDTQGVALWARQIGGDKFGNSSGAATDNDGNCYVTGLFQGTATFGVTTKATASTNTTSAYVAKFDKDGNTTWVRQSTSETGEGGQGMSISVDPLGNSYTAGYYNQGTISFGSRTLTNEENIQRLFIVKYDSQGNLIWATQSGGSDRSYVIPNGAANDSSGNSYVTGQFSGSVVFGATTVTNDTQELAIFVAKFDAEGHALWARRGGPSGNFLCGGITADRAGNCYVTGFFEGIAIFGSTILTNTGSVVGSGDIFVAKYDTAGNLQWAKQAGGSYGFGIAVDDAGNSYVTGQFSGPANFSGTVINGNGVFVAKYDPSGKLLWVKKGESDSASGRGIAVSRTGDIYVSGEFLGTAVFGATTLVNSGVVGKNGDIFVFKLSNP